MCACVFIVCVRVSLLCVCVCACMCACVCVCAYLTSCAIDAVLLSPLLSVPSFARPSRTSPSHFFFPACLTVFMFKHNRAAYDVLSNTVVVENEDL